MSCECGCGYEGEDPVAQWCIEEALMVAMNTVRRVALEEEQKEIEKQEMIANAHQQARAALERMPE